MHIEWWSLGLQTLNFAILVWLLHRFLYQPVLAMIDARRTEIARQFAAAKAAGDAAEARLAAVSAQRVDIAAEREAAVKAAAAQAQELQQKQRAEAESAARELLEAGRRTLATERERAFQEARRMALDLGADFARQLLDEVPAPLRAEAWIERIEQRLSSLPDPERAALAAELATGKPLSVVTAVALEPAAADAWRERLHRLLGASVAVSFEVNPGILGGAELHFPTALLRLSWQSALAAARAQADAAAHTAAHSIAAAEPPAHADAH